jgi:hypothetical protein
MSFRPDPQTVKVAFTSRAEAEAAFIDPAIPHVLIGQTVFDRVAANPWTASAFQDATGAWFTPIRKAANGPVEVWVLWGQSEARGTTYPAGAGSDGSQAVGGDRAARSNVLVYKRGTTVSGEPDGWYAAGPQDPTWHFHSSIAPVGSPIYLAAAARATEIGGTVCIVMDAIGGQPSGQFVQGGPRWAGLQASWSAAQVAPLPGRGGQTLANLNKTRADVIFIWQGSSDNDASLGVLDGAAATADEWVTRWRTILNSLEAPSGSSVPIAAPDRTKFIFFEMLHGATSGGSPGVGNPTDDRNRDLHKLLLYTSGKRAQIRIVPMGGVNNFTSDPERIGSFDNLHLNGAAYNDVARRVTAVLNSFDPTAPHSEYLVNSNGFTEFKPDGTFVSWSTDRVVTLGATVAVGSLFRSSYSTWSFPVGGGFAFAAAPNVTPCQSSLFPSSLGVHNVTTTTAQLYVLSPVSFADPITIRARADGFWLRT